MRSAWVLLIALTLPTVARTAEPDRYALFFDRIQPLLAARCVQCHGPDKQKGDLRLDSREALLKGGKSGPAFESGKPDESLLLRVVRHAEGVQAMPPKEHITDEAINDLSAWVRDGAVWPAPARVLFEDEESILKALPSGDGGGEARLVADDHFSGKAALAITGQRQSAQVEGWAFRIREKPGVGEYRFLRFAWKKRGGGAMMLEAANNGQWRTQPQKNAAWVAGAIPRVGMLIPLPTKRRRSGPL